MLGSAEGLNLPWSVRGSQLQGGISHFKHQTLGFVVFLHFPKFFQYFVGEAAQFEIVMVLHVEP